MPRKSGSGSSRISLLEARNVSLSGKAVEGRGEPNEWLDPCLWLAGTLEWINRGEAPLCGGASPLPFVSFGPDPCQAKESIWGEAESLHAFHASTRNSSSPSLRAWWSLSDACTYSFQFLRIAPSKALLPPGGTCLGVRHDQIEILLVFCAARIA